MRLLILILATSCKTRSIDQSLLTPLSSFTGYDETGKAYSCNQDPSPCENPASEFATTCQAKSGTYFRCNCKLALCSINIKRLPAATFGSDPTQTYRGYDQQGNLISCRPLPLEQTCPPSKSIDAFTASCLAKKSQYARCSCESYLCDVPVL
jgi:hypothetical protein